MDPQAFFWRTMAGELPPPRAVQTLGGRIVHADAEAGTVEATFQATEALTNPMGQVQGGFLAAMLDGTLGPALAATLARGQFAPTLQLSVTFLRPAKIGLVHGTGRVLRRGREVCHLAGELRQDGEVVASALATALVRQAAPGDKPTPPFTPGADHVAP